jgi:DNA-binding transcriptional LysR family regulator
MPERHHICGDTSSKRSTVLKTGIRYFAEVVQHGSIRAAAGDLGVAQSAISRQLQALERELGVPLLERRPRGVALTPAGELVFAYARETAFHTERLSSEIDALQGLRRGHVRIHAIEAMVPHLLPRAIDAFLAQFPGINFEVEVAGSDRVQVALREGRAEIGICFCAELASDIRLIFQVKEPLFAIVAPDHPLASHGKISVRELATWPVAVPGRLTGTRRLFDSACRQAKVEVKPALDTNSVELMHRFALVGHGVAVLTRLTCVESLAKRQLVALRFKEPEMSRGTIDVIALAGRRLPVAAERFLVPLRRILDAPTHAA